jgi:hypothetical protein
MTSIEIAPGQLVRYRETKSRWYFAVVRRVAKAGVELRFFDGDRGTVPSADVEPVETFFDPGQLRIAVRGTIDEPRNAAARRRC